ncbi:DUF4157 domain-containing protein [Streptomyces sp. SBC-4]|nr:DUF4157 domain-containing protein [Streptomyces sp. SBC-4]MDV5144353.1 DUF4157 domain-containing protein [Streptomyces sp. SBC-4]
MRARETLQPADRKEPSRTAARIPAPPGAAAAHMSPQAFLALQRAAGNAAVVHMLRQGGGPGAREQHQHGAGCGHQQTERPQVQRSAVHDVLRGGGRPLDVATRTDMEARLGADFSDVRLHTGSAAKASAAEVGARAYTSGSHVVIGDGGADKHTLAHELTHVIQQRQGPVAGTDNGSGLKISDPSDRFEREAEANAIRAMSGSAASVRESGVATHSESATGKPAAERAQVQRVTSLYSRSDTHQDRNNDLGFRAEEIISISHTREGISPRIKTIMDGYGDGNGQGVYNHHVPHSAIVRKIKDGLNFQSRDQIVTRLNNASATLGTVEAVPENEFVHNPWASRSSFDSWVDEKICNIADWPANLFRWNNTGDRGGTQIDDPIAPNPHLATRLAHAQNGLRAAGLL